MVEITREITREKPNLLQRSREELIYTHLLCTVFGLGNKQTFKEALVGGDKLFKSDIALALPNMTLVIEYDGGYWHGEKSVERDLSKTQKILMSDENTCLVRFRNGAAHLETPVGYESRCLVINEKTTNQIKQVTETLKALSKQKDIASHIKSAKISKSHFENTNKIVNEVIEECSESYKDARVLMLSVLGSIALVDKVFGIDGVLCRPMTIANGIKRLKDEYGLRGQQLVTFMCSGIASKLGNEQFWNDIQKSGTPVPPDPLARTCLQNLLLSD